MLILWQQQNYKTIYLAQIERKILTKQSMGRMLSE